MERFTISIEDKLAAQLDDYIRQHNYSNRSEAFRDIIRQQLQSEQLQSNEQGHCIANLSYVYNHHESELAGRITSAHHAHHDLTITSMHVHLDHDNCLEVVILKGTIAAVQEFANTVMSVRGVRHGQLHMIPITLSETEHMHGSGADKHTHIHPHT
ncbi:MAG: nickel-responsive transcriptional regulator NikR [Gammaproteobacteria bacterium]|nr:nickel-responsive transcriptional regulator NikR [Gammaproteobacteria bacterium]